MIITLSIHSILSNIAHMNKVSFIIEIILAHT